MRPQTLLEAADRFPPFIVRFVARKNHGHKPKSHADIAKLSGLSRPYVSQLSKRRTWRGIPINVVDAFSLACGVDLLHPKRTVEFLRWSKKHHLYGADKHQRKFLAKLISKGKTMGQG